jgi:hypothetical protein
MSNEIATEKLEDIWVGFGLDPIAQKLIVMGFVPNKEDALAEAVRYPELAYLRAFCLMSPTFGSDLYDWFISCGVVSTDAVDMVRQYGAILGRVCDEHPPHP